MFGGKDTPVLRSRLRGAARLLVLFSLLIACNTVVSAAPRADTPKAGRVAVLVLVPAVSLADLRDTKTTGIRALLAGGAVGVMNARTGANTAGRISRPIDSLVLHPEEIRPTTLEAGYLTLGAGTRCFARTEADEAFEAAEQSGEGGSGAAVWMQRTGHRAGKTHIFHLNIIPLATAQEKLPYEAAPGALGEALRKAKLHTAVVGNADDESGPHRDAVTVAMDHLGRVSLGAIGSALNVKDASVPGGFRANPEAVLNAVEAARAAGARLIVVETGDTARVDRADEEIQSALRPRRRREAIRRIDRIVTGLREQLDPKQTLLLLVCPVPSLDAARAGNTLTPMVLAGAGIAPGLIYSPSTRTPGLATNTDIAATVLNFLNVPAPSQVVGRPLSAAPHTKAVDAALALESSFRRIDTYSRPLARVIVWLQVVLFVLFLVLVWLCPGFATRPSRALYTGSLAIAAMPAAILWVGLFEPGSSAAGIFLFILLLAALMAVAAALNRRLAAVAGLWLLGGMLFLYDQAHGNALLQASPLGYSPYAGARFYGIGNEGFGLLIPAVLLGFALAFERRQARAGRQSLMIAVLAFLLAAIIGENSMGANFGGALGAAAAGITALTVALHRRLSRRALFGIALAGCVLTLLPFIPEMLAGADKQSHIGRALSMLGNGGLGGVWDIMFRKLSMNLKLLRFSPWSRLLFAAIFALVLLMRQRWEQLRAERPLLHVALVATLGGALGALVCNDSGVQPAAEMASAAAAAVAYWRCEKGGTAANRDGSLP